MWFLIVLGVLIAALLIAFFVVKNILNKFMAERPPLEKRWEGGEKRALLLFQPTRHETAAEYAEQIAKGLHARGYDVTLNFPSRELTYDVENYDLLVFGTGAYMNMGGVPVRRYIKEHPFARKQVVLFSVGANLNSDPEIEQMKSLVGPGNIIYQIKVSRGQEDVMADFLEKLELDDPDFDNIPEEEEDDEAFEEDDGEFSENEGGEEEDEEENRR